MYKYIDWIKTYKINWDNLSENPNALHLLEQNQDKICWNYLYQNYHLYFLNCVLLIQH